MDLVIPKKDLLRLVARCQGVADKKSAMPALANVLLAAEGNTLRVAATDLYLSVSGQTHAEIATSGSVAVPAKDLRELVALLKSNRNLQYNYGSTGPGSFMNVVGEALKRDQKIEMTHIPFKGAAPLKLELIAGRLGINVIGRHTALGDAIVTGEVFLRMIPLLAEMGIRTLGEARRASEKTYYARIKY